jgi:aconitate hydratase
MTKQTIVKSTFNIDNKQYHYFDINKSAQNLGVNVKNLPYCLKVLFENLLRHYDNKNITESHLRNLANSVNNPENRTEISFLVSRVLMQDFTGVPAVVDLAAMRDAVIKMGKDPKKINPQVPVDLVIDHSVQVDSYGQVDSYKKNVEIEYERNFERYQFLKWAQNSFDNFKVVPPGTGICHQVNIEKLATITSCKDDIAFFDTLVGTDSHTTMVNALGVLGWGVGGIEAEASMLGQPISMLIPQVIGFKLTGKLQEGLTATDLVLNVTEILRKYGVVGKFVEFFGPALKYLSLADRATISNMAPEYGATCGIFPVDEVTLQYLNLTGRSQHQIDLVRKYNQIQGTFIDNYDYEPEFSKIIELDISKIKPSLAGPKRPQDRYDLEDVAQSFIDLEESTNSKDNKSDNLKNGDIVIAAITSCTNTSNPAVLIAAGLIAKKAVELGLKVKPYVKTSFAPGSQVVSEYLNQSGLQKYLDQLGFNVVGYGCTTCIGNSGPLNPEIEKEIKDNNLVIGSILSGNRNFEGRIHQLVKANYLASPPLVMAYALAGNLKIDITTQPISQDDKGNDIYLKDIWPNSQEIQSIIDECVTRDIFLNKYQNLFEGDENWHKIKTSKSDSYNWDPNSTYIRLPNFFDNNDSSQICDIKSARIIALLGDSVTTDHISPAGNIASDSAAAIYLNDNNISKNDFNSYGSRRGNHEVMMRGTFANIRIKNLLLKSNKEGGYSYDINNNEVYFYNAAMSYRSISVPLIVMAGKEYGTGSSRDWAAKGTKLLGINAVIAQSFERIHRSNLIGMGVLPLCFKEGDSYQKFNITGDETIDILDINSNIKPKQEIKCIISKKDGTKIKIALIIRLDTENEVKYFKSGGILQYVLNNLVN